MRIKNVGVLTALAVSSLAAYSLIPTGCCKLKHGARRKKQDKVLYLTFDDGPHEKYTAELLDLLEQYEICASFFMVAEFARDNPDIVEKMNARGHVIGLHSLEHRNALWQPPGYTARDFERSLRIFRSLGVQIRYYRPPWGHFNVAALAEIRKNKLETILWDVMAQDWKKNTNATAIAKKLLLRANDGSIICLHDGRGAKDAPARTIEALKRVLPIWISNGYQFRTVDQYGK